MRTLRVDQVTAEVWAAMRQATVRPLLLKGPAIAGWLYDDGSLRPYCDSDLLVAPADHRTAERTLRDLGFRPGRADWLGISRNWQRDDDAVDLHASLLGVQVDASQAWQLLSVGTSQIVVGGRPVETLGIEARTVHLSLHAAQHGVRGVRALEDLERGLVRLDVSVWHTAGELARSLNAEGAFGAGLRLSVRGRELADQLGLSVHPSAAVALRSADPSPGALGFALLAECTGALARLRVVGRSLAPPPAHMRECSALARRGRSGLALAYIGRTGWLARHSVGGYRAWRRARRAELSGQAH
ncbi:MAG: nucleotidyltransferase family protein [Solirubrobacteraceae bacterium]